MKLSEKKSGSFEPHPEYTGPAVCVDITPPEIKETAFGPKEKFRVVFETGLNAKGESQCVWSQAFTCSLNEKAGLRKFLRQWFGRDLNAQELQEFDTESLLGKPAFIVVTHSQGENGETYANIAACTPYKGAPETAPKASGKFTRKKDRPAKDAAKGEGSQFRRSEQSADGQGGRDDWMALKVHVGKHAGVDLGDLDEDAVTKLHANWLPVFKANPKPLAADKRLADGLEKAIAAIAAAKAGGAGTPAPAVAESAY